MDIDIEVLELMDATEIENRLQISFGKAIKLHSKLGTSSHQKAILSENNSKVDELIKSVNDMRKQVMSESANQDSMSAETRHRLMKLRLDQLSAITQMNALKARNQCLDLCGDDIHTCSVSSIIDNLLGSIEKNLLSITLSFASEIKCYIKYFRKEDVVNVDILF